MKINVAMASLAMGLAAATAAQAAVFSGGTLTVTTGPNVISASAGPSGFWGEAASDAGTPSGTESGDVKVYLNHTNVFGGAPTLDNNVTYTLQFDARFSGYRGGFDTLGGVYTNSATGGVHGPFMNFSWFSGGDPIGDDNTWHHYSMTLTPSDTAFAANAQDIFGNHDWFIASLSNSDGPDADSFSDAFTFDIDNLRLTSPLDLGAGPSQFRSGPANENADFDNGDPFNPAVYGTALPPWEVRYGSAPGGFRIDPLVAIPEPGTAGLMLGVAGLFISGRRKRSSIMGV